MEKFKVTKEFTFCAAHRLKEHKGLCRNIHGHEYRVLVALTGIRNKEGMVMDFGHLKKLVKPYLDEWDHSIILEQNDSLVSILEKQGLSMNLMGAAPTAENMAHHLALYIRNLLQDAVYAVEVTVYETPTSFAIYEVEG